MPRGGVDTDQYEVGAQRQDEVGGHGRNGSLGGRSARYLRLRSWGQGVHAGRASAQLGWQILADLIDIAQG